MQHGWAEFKSAHDRKEDWFLSTEMSLPALESFATSCPHSLWFTAVTLASLISQTAEFHSRELQWLSAELRDEPLRHGREWVEKNGTWPNYMIWTENLSLCLQHRNKKQSTVGKDVLHGFPLMPLSADMLKLDSLIHQLSCWGQLDMRNLQPWILTCQLVSLAAQLSPY